MKRVINEGARITGSKIQSTSYTIDATNIETLSVHNVFTVAGSDPQNFASATDVDAGTDIITVTGHGFETGRKVALSTAGVLPAGLSATNYWMIAVTANTLKFAASLADAIAGTAVDITDAGTGTHTLTPAALSSCSVKLQESNDNSDFIDIASMTTSITATGSSIFKPTVSSKYIKIVFSITDGQVDIDCNVFGTGS